MRDEDDVVVELAVGELLAPCFNPRLDQLSPPLLVIAKKHRKREDLDQRKDCREQR